MKHLDRYTQPAIAEHARRYNVAPGQHAPVITPTGVHVMRWGLLAPWRGHGGTRPPPIITAQLSTIASTPVLARAKRCLVVADGWFARQKFGARIHAWWIHGAPAFAGVYATHADDGIAAFTIIVAPSTTRAALLPCAADEQWIADGAPLAISWREVEVSRAFEDESRDDAACIAPLGNPDQGSLF